MVVHLPIGLLLTAALVECWRWFQGRSAISAFTPIALWISAFTGAVSAGTGWLFAEEEGGGDDLFWHRWLGIALVVLLIPLAWKAWRAVRPGDTAGAQLAPLVRGLVLGVSLLTYWVGHLGGGMVWGNGFVLKPLEAWNAGPQDVGVGVVTPPLPTVSSESSGSAAPEDDLQSRVRAAFFATDVLPILQAHCHECHANGKHKGGLAMDDPAQLVRQNEEGVWIIRAGHPQESDMVARITLGADVDGAMPPEGARLSEAQVSAIRAWIQDGAATTVPAAPVPTPVSLPRASGVTSAPSAPAPKVSAEQDKAVRKLRELGVIVQPLSQQDGWLEVNASSKAAGFTDAHLALLAPLAPLMAELNLSRTAVTDGGIATLRAMPALNCLRLDGTTTGDAAVATILDRAPNVQALHLVGTAVTDATAVRLAAHQPLIRVYVWGTGVTPNALQELREARPKALVDGGAFRP
jgi:mono/diheme cytochrome c family protein